MELHRRLTELLERTPLQWPSKTTEPVEVCRLWFWQLWRSNELGNGNYDLFAVSKISGFAEGWRELTYMFNQWGEPISYRRSTGKPGEYELVIGIRQGWQLIGLKTKIVES